MFHNVSVPHLNDNHIFEDEQNSISVSTNSDPDMLVEEWANDSRILLADACAVRRYLRIVFKGFLVYREIANHIRDDVFVAESRSHNRILLRSLLIWFHHMDRVRLEAERSRLTKSVCHKSRLKEFFASWKRSLHISRKLHELETSIKDRLVISLIQSWYEVTVPYVAVRKKLIRRKTFSLLKNSISEWRKERTLSHLNDLHRTQQMERFHLSMVFRKLAAYRRRSERVSMAQTFHSRKINGKLFSVFRSFKERQKVNRDRILDSDNRLFGYMVVKLAAVADDCEKKTFEKNVNIVAKCEPYVNASICHVVLDKWRNHVMNESVRRARSKYDAVSNTFGAWRQYSKRTQSLISTVNTLLSGDKYIGKYFSLWIIRANKRKQFRENISDFATRTILSTEHPVFREWRKIVSSEKNLRQISQKVSRRILGAKFMRLWVETFRKRHRECVMNEIGLLLQRKLASKRILACLIANKKLETKKREIENIGNIFWKKLMINRWRIVLATKIAWASAFGYLIDQCDRNRLRQGFKEWVRLIRLGVVWGKKMEEKNVKLRRKILVVFQMNAKYEMDKRRADSVTGRFQLKHALKRWRRYRENGKVFTKFLNWKILRNFFAKWIHARIIQARIDSLTTSVEKAMLRIALYQLIIWNSDTRDEETKIREKIFLDRLKNIFWEWNYGMKTNKLQMKKEANKLSNEAQNQRLLLANFWTILRANFSQSRGLKYLQNKYEARLKRLVFSSSSSWRHSVAKSKIRNLVRMNLFRTVLEEWERATHMVKIHEIELEGLADKFERKFTRIIFSSWYFHVANRQYVQMHALVKWHETVSEMNRKRQVIHEMHSRYIGGLMGNCFTHWRGRLRSRLELRDRVLTISSKYMENQMRNIFECFYKNVSLRKNFRIIKETSVRRYLVSLIDKWVNGTVILISVRESMARIVLRISPKMNLIWAMNELRENARISRLYVDKQEFLNKADSRRNRRIQGDVLSVWSQVAQGLSDERERIGWMRKRVGMDRLKNFISSRRERVFLESVADEFLVEKETDKLTFLITYSLLGWRDLVACERLLSEKKSVLERFKESGIMLKYFCEWTYQKEIVEYEKNLAEKGNELTGRKNFRDRTKVFNQLILLFLERTEVAKIGVDFHRFILERRVLSAFKRNHELGRKRSGLSRWIHTKILRQCFDSLFREVYLTFKERIAYRRIRCLAALRKLSQYTQYRKDRAMMKVFGKWKREKEDVPRNIEAETMVPMKHGVVLLDDAVANAYGDTRSNMSYREIRSRSVTPSSNEVSSINETNESSYRKQRRSKAHPGRA